MDHTYIEEHNVIARYEMGKLPAAECVLFEEHFADCQACQEQTELARDFRRVLKKVVAADAAGEELQASRGSRANLPFLQAWRPMAVAVAACIILSVLPAILVMRHLRALHGQLDRSKVAAEAYQRQYKQEHQTASLLHKQFDEASQKAQAQPVLASIFTLNVVRSSDDSEPVNQVAISRLQSSIILSIDQDPAEGFKSYRITLEDSAGSVLWTKNDIQRSRTNAFGITVPSSLFHQGNYLLKLEGLSAKGTCVSSGHYPFHVKALP
jgi:hypothetical protein